MNSKDLKVCLRSHCSAFTLVEMLVVIAIMGILMTAGAVGLGGLGGKGVSSGVATAESLFEEARAIAVGQRVKSRLLVAKTLTNNPGENLRRILIAAQTLDANGNPVAGAWTLSSRGQVLPDQVFFSQTFSKRNHGGGAGASIPLDGTMEMGSALITDVRASYAGTYYFYEFNAEGICSTPGASFVIGSGSRNLGATAGVPRVTSAGKSDFGGFVIWRKGSTSLFRNPQQISPSMRSLRTGAEF